MVQSVALARTAASPASSLAATARSSAWDEFALVTTLVEEKATSLVMPLAFNVATRSGSSQMGEQDRTVGAWGRAARPSGVSMSA